MVASSQILSILRTASRNSFRIENISFFVDFKFKNACLVRVLLFFLASLVWPKKGSCRFPKSTVTSKWVFTRPVFGQPRSGTHSVQGTLSWVEFPVYSTQLNWTYAATCILFSWVEGMRYIQVQLSISNFPLERFGDNFFLQSIQTTRQLQPSLRHLVVDSKVKWKRNLVRTQHPEDGLANPSSG